MATLQTFKTKRKRINLLRFRASYKKCITSKVFFSHMASLIASNVFVDTGRQIAEGGLD
jgi:hypothetical protein